MMMMTDGRRSYHNILPTDAAAAPFHQYSCRRGNKQQHIDIVGRRVESDELLPPLIADTDMQQSHRRICRHRSSSSPPPRLNATIKSAS